MIADSVLSISDIKYLMSAVGFAKSNGIFNSFNSLELILFSHFVIKSTGTLPASSLSESQILLKTFHFAIFPFSSTRAVADEFLLK